MRYLPKTSNYFVNVIINILIIACLIMFYFNDFLRLSGFAVSLFFIVLPDYWYSQSKKVKSFVDIKLINAIQLIIAFSCLGNLLGALNFYHNLETLWYDAFLHFIVPIFYFSITALFVISYQNFFFKKINKVFTIFGNFVLVILLSFSWEFFEKSIDDIFEGASMFGQNGEIYYDTLSDLIFDLSGGIVASILIYFFTFNYIIKNLNIYDNKRV